MFQEELLHHLKKELPENSSLIEAVAIALEISYDAAHRRVSLKSKISIDEGVLLAQYYNISIDRLFSTTSAKYLVVEKTKHITNEMGLIKYLNDSYDSILPLSNQKEVKAIYSAKDIPLFYTISDNLLGKFKMYVWLKLLDKSFSLKSFQDFNPSLSLVNAGKKLGDLYSCIQKTEIWDVTTVNSTLKQIHFYFQAGHLSINDALLMCDILKQLILNLSKRLTSSDNNYQIYYNELHLMDNNVLIESPNAQVLYVPFTLLSYYKTSDKETCNEAKLFLNKQLRESKLLNTVGEKERNTFFIKIQAKIDALKQLINATNILGFE